MSDTEIASHHAEVKRRWELAQKLATQWVSVNMRPEHLEVDGLLFSTGALAEVLGCSERSVRTWNTNGRLGKKIKGPFGTRILVQREELEQFGFKVVPDAPTNNGSHPAPEVRP
jgi:hypothetical protein